MKFGLAIRGPQWMYPTDFGFLLTFPLAPARVYHLRFCAQYVDKYWTDCQEILLQTFLFLSG